MKRRLWTSLIATTLVTVAVFAANLATGTAPLLGLDLQGGASVVLEPAGDATGEDLTVVRDLIRDELERTGIAEPNVRVQGDTIVVELPGVKDQQAALEAVDVSGIVELRPVVDFAQCTDAIAEAPDGVSVDPTAPVSTLGVLAGEAAVPDATEGSRSLRSPDTSPEPEPLPDLATVTSSTGAELLFTREGQPLCVGPAQGTGEVFERQSAIVDNQFGFQVNVELNGGEGTATWNSLAAQCFNGTPTCPRTNPGSNGQLAIVLDGEIQSAPSVNQPNFDGAV